MNEEVFDLVYLSIPTIDSCARLIRHILVLFNLSWIRLILVLTCCQKGGIIRGYCSQNQILRCLLSVAKLWTWPWRRIRGHGCDLTSISHELNGLIYLCGLLRLFFRRFLATHNLRIVLYQWLIHLLHKSIKQLLSLLATQNITVQCLLHSIYFIGLLGTLVALICSRWLFLLVNSNYTGFSLRLRLLSTYVVPDILGSTSSVRI